MIYTIGGAVAYCLDITRNVVLLFKYLAINTESVVIIIIVNRETRKEYCRLCAMSKKNISFKQVK